jgi:hypothetical protein
MFSSELVLVWTVVITKNLTVTDLLLKYGALIIIFGDLASCRCLGKQ